MLKKFNSADIDILMNLWKKEFQTSQNTNILTAEYTKVRDKFLDKNTTTVLYTEDGVIEGFISIDKDNEIWNIFVSKYIRREGIGSILISHCKKKYSILTVHINNKDKQSKAFFEKNEFKKSEKQIDDKILYTWGNDNIKSVNLIYFDEDLNVKYRNANSSFNIKQVKLKEMLQNGKTQIKEIKTYIKIKKEIEKGFSTSNVLMYIDYNNYYEALDELIMEIVKIKKTNLEIVICEPFSIESSKKEKNIEIIENNYKDYKIHKINSVLDMSNDVSVNQIFEKRMEIVMQKIEKIAENM